MPPLKTFQDGRRVATRLGAAGVDAAQADGKARLFEICAAGLEANGVPQNSRATAFFIPARIEVVGKHTDYAGGCSLVAAAQRSLCLVSVGRNDNALRILDTSQNRHITIELGADRRIPRGHWANYPATVARRLAKDFPIGLVGADVAMASDIPPAAGLGSSSTMVTAFFLALAAANNLAMHGRYRQNIKTMEDLAEYLGAVENGSAFGNLRAGTGVGTLGGSQDHAAILCSRPGYLRMYSYRPIRLLRNIEFPPGYVFVIASSGHAARKTGEARPKYNLASRLCRSAVQVWNSATGRSDPHLAAALASSPDAEENLRGILNSTIGGTFKPEQLLKRYEHFLAEDSQIVPTAAHAFARGDMAQFGRQVARSQQLAQTLLGNQVPETVFLADSAVELGAEAASSFGAGYGGSAWALVKTEAAGGFTEKWQAAYNKRFPENAPKAEFFPSRPGPAAFEL
jgi:galactokinase